MYISWTVAESCRRCLCGHLLGCVQVKGLCVARRMPGQLWRPKIMFMDVCVTRYKCDKHEKESVGFSLCGAPFGYFGIILPRDGWACRWIDLAAPRTTHRHKNTGLQCHSFLFTDCWTLSHVWPHHNVMSRDEMRANRRVSCGRDDVGLLSDDSWILMPRLAVWRVEENTSWILRICVCVVCLDKQLYAVCADFNKAFEMHMMMKRNRNWRQ